GIVGDQFEKDLFNEIKTMSYVHSQYVTQLYGICWEKDFKCLIIEYMPKGSLYYCLDNPEILLSAEQKKEIALDIARGLYNLSCLGMLHGNLNSYNVVMGEGMRPKLTDFSCAETRQVAMTSVKQARNPIESFEWAAPELLSLQPRTAASDIYSFGMILWE